MIQSIKSLYSDQLSGGSPMRIVYFLSISGSWPCSFVLLLLSSSLTTTFPMINGSTRKTNINEGDYASHRQSAALPGLKSFCPPSLPTKSSQKYEAYLGLPEHQDAS